MSKHVVTIDGEQYTIPDSDIWRKSGCDKDIIKHDGVRRLMVKAGIAIESVEPIVMPVGESAIRIAFLACGTNAEGRKAFAIGESDPSNLAPNSVASRYPTIMAFKRAIDRLVLDLVGLFDLYSETEFAEPPARSETSSPSPKVDASASSANGNGDLPPTDKQISYLWQLGLKNGLTEPEVDSLVRTVRTRAGASKLIASMRQMAA